MTINNRVGLGAFRKALWAALQWRVMLIWIVLMALPTAIVTLPVGRALGALLEHSVHANALAHQFNGLYMGDALMLLVRHNGSIINGAGLLGLVISLLLSPFLTGVVVTAVREPRSPGLGELMHGGLREYWRMLRLMLWSLLPYAIAILIGVAAHHVADKRADAATLQSVADRGYLAARIVLIVLLVLAHAIMETGRAQFAADGELRSATRAFGRGIVLLVRRPLAALGLYLGTSIVGYVLAGLVGMLRIRIEAVGAGFVVAVLLTQVIVLILAWQRTARIGALATLARATPARQQAGSGVLVT